MASIVTINASTTRLSLNPGDTAALSFDVANAADRPVTVRAQMVGAGAAVPDPDWLRVEGEAQFTLAPAETRQVSVSGTPPAGAMRVALEVYETALPEENVDRSAPVEITAGAAAAGGKGWVLPVVIAAVVVLAIGGGVAWWLLRDPGLPNVTGLAQADAVAALEEREYTDLEIVPVVAPDETPGTVLSADIVEGTEDDEPPVVRVEVAASGLPDVEGLDAEQAAELLAEAGVADVNATLVAGPAEQAGQVIGQSPEAFEVFDETTVVELTIGAIEVPEVRGRPFNAANRALRDAGLVLGDRSERDDPNRRRDTVLSSTPSSGALVGPGTAVDLVVDSADPVVTPPTPPSSGLDEDCLRVDPDRLEITALSNGFRVGEPGRSRFQFQSQQVAEQTIFILQKYEIDEICYVERPNPPMIYIKTRGQAPQGELTPELCFRFDPDSLDIRRDGANWLLTNSVGGEFRFDSEEAAKLAANVIQDYEMTHLCSNGGDFSKFHYFRR